MKTSPSPDFEAPIDLRFGQPKGQPYLQMSTTSNFTWIYDDSGSGASMDVTIYRPTPTSTDYFILGDYAQSSYTPPSSVAQTRRVAHDRQ